MHIYFVRHGETEYNRRGIHQHEDVPLSARGREQMEVAAQALKSYPIGTIVSSDLARAKESADIVGRTLGLPVAMDKLFREVQRPSNLYNKRHFSLTTLVTGLRILHHFFDPKWHYSDEENFNDVKLRIEHAVEELAKLSRENEHIVVVSHAFIINIFVKYMCSYKRVRRRDYLRTLVAAKLFSNASITTVAYNNDQNPHTCDWICLDINNTDHLK